MGTSAQVQPTNIIPFMPTPSPPEPARKRNSPLTTPNFITRNFAKGFILSDFIREQTRNDAHALRKETLLSLS